MLIHCHYIYEVSKQVGNFYLSETLCEMLGLKLEVYLQIRISINNTRDCIFVGREQAAYDRPAAPARSAAPMRPTRGQVRSHPYEAQGRQPPGRY